MTNSLRALENRFPGCVRMELKISPSKPTRFMKEIDQKEPELIDLILNIDFGEHQEEIHHGSGNVTFGLKRGELRIKLINGEVPLENIKLKDEFQPVINRREIELRRNTNRIRIGVGLRNFGFTGGGEITAEQLETVEIKEYQVKTGGGKLDEPSWVFEVKTRQNFLEGLLQNIELATVNVKAIPCHLVATFIVRKPEDICITYGELFGIRNITRTKLTIIQKGIVRLFLNEILNQKPYLSRVELIHE